MTDAVDVAVIGGGLVGNVFRARLAQVHPALKVCVVERGGLTSCWVGGDLHPYNDEYFRFRRIATGLGGRGTLWGGVVFSMSEETLKRAYPDDPRARERVMAHYPQVDELGRISRAPFPSFGPIQTFASEKGYLGTPRLMGPTGSVFSGVPSSLNHVILPSAVNRLDFTRHHVNVLGHDLKPIVSASRVVISAGTIESFAIMSRSVGGDLVGAVSDHLVLGMHIAVAEPQFDADLDMYLPPAAGQEFYTLVQSRRSVRGGTTLELDVWGMIDLSLHSAPTLRQRNGRIFLTPSRLSELQVLSALDVLGREIVNVVNDLASILNLPRVEHQPRSFAPGKLPEYRAESVSSAEWQPYMQRAGSVHHEYGSLSHLGIEADSSISAIAGRVWLLGGARASHLGPYNPTKTYLADALGLAEGWS